MEVRFVCSQLNYSVVPAQVLSEQCEGVKVANDLMDGCDERCSVLLCPILVLKQG